MTAGKRNSTSIKKRGIQVLHCDIPLIRLLALPDSKRMNHVFDLPTQCVYICVPPRLPHKLMHSKSRRCEYIHRADAPHNVSLSWSIQIKFCENLMSQDERCETSSYVCSPDPPSMGWPKTRQRYGFIVELRRNGEKAGGREGEGKEKVVTR